MRLTCSPPTGLQSCWAASCLVSSWQESAGTRSFPSAHWARWQETLCCSWLAESLAPQSNAFIRINQVGYLASDAKVAIAFSRTALQGDFVLLDTSNRVVYRAPLKSVPAPSWGGSFPFYYELNFSAFKQRGRHMLRLQE